MLAEFTASLVPAEIVAIGMTGVVISGLLWLRLLAGGASPKQAGQIIVAIWFLAVVFLWSVATAVAGWREKNWSAAFGMGLGVMAFLLLRQVLRKAWDWFPLE